MCTVTLVHGAAHGCIKGAYILNYTTVSNNFNVVYVSYEKQKLMLKSTVSCLFVIPCYEWTDVLIIKVSLTVVS